MSVTHKQVLQTANSAISLRAFVIRPTIPE
jgi:hypothetical protein